MDALLLGSEVAFGVVQWHPSADVLRKMKSAKRLRRNATYFGFDWTTTLGWT
jgi:hypothetical protein